MSSQTHPEVRFHGDSKSHQLGSEDEPPQLTVGLAGCVGEGRSTEQEHQAVRV